MFTALEWTCIREPTRSIITARILTARHRRRLCGYVESCHSAIYAGRSPSFVPRPISRDSIDRGLSPSHVMFLLLSRFSRTSPNVGFAQRRNDLRVRSEKQRDLRLFHATPCSTGRPKRCRLADDRTISLAAETGGSTAARFYIPRRLLRSIAGCAPQVTTCSGYTRGFHAWTVKPFSAGSLARSLANYTSSEPREVRNAIALER